MRKLFLLIVLLFSMVTIAQTDSDYNVQVFVDSLIIRSLPDRDSDPAASAFENDVLVAVGRNADGTWLEVRRPGREGAAGWVARQYVSYMFEVAELPITDFTTGVTGPEVVFDSGVSVFILTEVALRDRPSINGERIGIVPITRTIPAFERSPDSLWFHVNYLGTTGWVAEFLVRTTADVSALPISPDFALTVISLEVIPIEVQLGQVNRLREFFDPLQDVSASMADFWSIVSSGEIVPCDPPAGGYIYYSYTPRDVVELPELRRYVNRMQVAVDSLNRSIDMMQRCGVYTEEEISRAYSGAVNASIIFEATLGTLRNLEENVLLQ